MQHINFSIKKGNMFLVECRRYILFLCVSNQVGKGINLVGVILIYQITNNAYSWITCIKAKMENLAFSLKDGVHKYGER